MMDERRARGICGEECAAAYLRVRGWKICARNYRGARGEIDLIAAKEGFLAFVEVKARTQGYMADPAAAVGRTKRGRIVRCAERFLLDHEEYQALQPRFDVAEVLLARGEIKALGIRYLPNAFDLRDL